MRQAARDALPRRGLLRGPERPGGVPQVLGHPVEGVHQHPHLAAARGRHAGVELAAGDRADSLGERLHRTGDAAGEEEAGHQREEQPQRAGGEQRAEEGCPGLVRRRAPDGERQLRGPERERAPHGAPLGGAGRRRAEAGALQLHPRAGEPRQARHPRIVEHLATDQRGRAVRRLHRAGRDQGRPELHPLGVLHLHRHHHRGLRGANGGQPGLDVTHPRGEEGAGAAHAGGVAQGEDAEGTPLGHAAHRVGGGGEAGVELEGDRLGDGVRGARADRLLHVGPQAVQLGGGEGRRRVGAGGQLAGEGDLDAPRGEGDRHREGQQREQREGEEQERAEPHPSGSGHHGHHASSSIHSPKPSRRTSTSAGSSRPRSPST